jgi:hypothetical protein
MAETMRFISTRTYSDAPLGFASKVVSFTPGFSPVSDRRSQQKTVSTVFLAFAIDTLETVSHHVITFPPG